MQATLPFSSKKQHKSAQEIALSCADFCFDGAAKAAGDLAAIATERLSAS